MSSTAYVITDEDKKSFPEGSKGHSQAGKYTGMNPERHTTDIIFLLLIIGAWAAMTAIGAQSIQQGGDLYRLIDPMDSGGSICGHSPSVQNAGKLYTVTSSGLGTCVATCPGNPAPLTSTNPQDYICLQWVYDSFSPPYDNTNTALKTYISSVCMVGGYFTSSVPGQPADLCGCNIKTNTTDVFNRCVFTDATLQSYYNNQNLPDYFNGFMSDIIAGRYVIFLFGFLAALALAFFYTYLMRYETLGLYIVWFCIFAVFATMCIVLELSVMTYRDWRAQSPPQHSGLAQNALLGWSIALTILMLLFVIVCITQYKAIFAAVKVISLASHAIESMPLIVFAPKLQVLGFAIFMIPFVFYCFNIASNGTWSTTTTTCYGTLPTCSGPHSGPFTTIRTGQKYTLNAASSNGQLWFLFFVLLWTGNLIGGIGSIASAIACAKWYFTPTPDKGSVGSMTVVWAYGQALRYHVGTAAFGGLLIAVVQFIRWVALYVEKQFQTTVKDSCLIRVLCCWVGCFLWCLEKCLKFVSKEAYIQTAIHSTSFCTGCFDAFFLIARNIFSVGAVSVISGVALLIGKIFVMALVSLGAFVWFYTRFQGHMYDFVAPTILVMIISYFTATMFMDALHALIDSMIICYLTDSEQNGGKPQYSTDFLKEWIMEKGGLDEDHIALNQAKAANKGSVAASPAGTAAPVI